jgi:hypothetical protein
MSLTNLTPHPIRVYGWDVPDRFELGDHEPLLELPPSGQVARIGQIEIGGAHLKGCDAPVEMIEYRHINGIPPKHTVPWDNNTDWYVVSLPLALACNSPDDKVNFRNDLLVPFLEVRNSDGTVIG